jgi:hypothetical protein
MISADLGSPDEEERTRRHCGCCPIIGDVQLNANLGLGLHFARRALMSFSLGLTDQHFELSSIPDVCNTEINLA